MPWLVAILTVLAAYFIGAIPFGFLVARMRGVDIFAQGSGNIGATNVGRVLGMRFGMLVFTLDFAKGATPVALAILLKTQFHGQLWTGGYVEVAAGLSAFLGHLFPIYLRFHGGKGVAAGCGVVAILLPIPTAAALLVWFVLLCATRYMSLASIAAVLVLTAVHLRQPSAWDWTEPRTWFCVVAGGLVIVRHHANIGRLVRGTENQLQESVIMQQLCKSLHVLALGLWFGMAIFFTFVVALSLFGTFESLAKQEKRATWFPHAPLFKGDKDGMDGAREQGTRAAGYAVGPMFLWYFALQGVCGFIALATALPWLKQESRVNRWRVNLLVAAVATVLIGWPLEQHVSALRDPRNDAIESYLKDRSDEDNAKAMQQARAEFGRWHGYSLALNFATITFVTAALALAGNLGDAATKKQDAQEPNLATDETRIKHG